MQLWALASRLDGVLVALVASPLRGREGGQHGFLPSEHPPLDALRLPDWVPLTSQLKSTQVMITEVVF